MLTSRGIPREYSLMRSTAGSVNNPTSRAPAMRSRVRIYSRARCGVLEDVLENAVEGQGAIEDRRDRGLAVEPLSQGLEQGGLSGAHLAGQHDEALPFLDAVLELGEGLPVARTHIEEAGVRGRVERLVRESVKRQIHATALRSPHFAP